MAYDGEKIIRTLCVFEEKASLKSIDGLGDKKRKLESEGYSVQTLRLCPEKLSLRDAAALDAAPSLFVGAGPIERRSAERDLDHFLNAENVSFHIEPETMVSMADVELLFRIIGEKPEKTFNFAFAFNNVHSSPFFPSARYKKCGFSVGLQPTNLATGCLSLNEWFKKLEQTWIEIAVLFKDDNFIGIDSSIAPLYSGSGSLINFIKTICGSFSGAVTSDVFLQISAFIKQYNPVPAGLCGIMFPCLEDFELAEEYESGNFPVERNIFLSLHSGLGIDTYPLAKDESPERVLEVLRLLQGLSDKYRKPLAARFVCDGISSAGDKTVFNNQYLKDVILREL